MTVREEVQIRARLMSRELTEQEELLLDAASAAAVAELSGWLKEGLQPEDCLADFVTAAAMLTLASMSEIGDGTGIEQFTAGDVTLRRGSGNNTAASCLRLQAHMLMGPCLKTDVAFLGV